MMSSALMRNLCYGRRTVTGCNGGWLAFSQQHRFNSTKDQRATYRQNVRKNVQGYVFTRYIDYLKNYDKVLESKFPVAMKMYKTFMLGVKDFYNDMKVFLKVTRIANNSVVGLRALNRKELELYQQMPRDMLKILPVLLLSALPFANYVILPLAYMFPRHLLTSHFWTPEQRAKFQQILLRHRIEHNRRVFRCLQAKLKTNSKESSITPIEKKWAYILGLLGSGIHPTANEVLSVKEIFTKKPYHLDSLSSKHLKYLCHLNGIHGGTLKRFRLSERSYTIHHMDLAIKREGGVHNMPIDSLRHACYLRGLNPLHLSHEKLIEWLQEWVKVSLEVNQDNISMFAHLPILIGYNHPNNWQLTHSS